MTVKVRFAPSPTGYLHVGNVRAALLNWLFARKHGGEFILRIDDTDAVRSRDQFIEAIRRDLGWLGLDWDEEIHQSNRVDRYDAAIEDLKTAGRLYPCYETAEELDLKRKTQLGRGQPPVYDRAALKLGDADRSALEAQGRRPHWRFKLDKPGRAEWSDLIRGLVSIDMESVSDPVLVRADGTYLYMLPSCVDDLDLGITHVVRGEDHVTNSGVQIQIFEALGGHAPEMAHYALFRAKEGQKLSKRKGGSTVESFREEQGLEPATVTSFLARLGSSQPIEPIVDLESLVQSFDFSHFSKAAVTFDVEELKALNAKILHNLPYEAVKDRPELEGADSAFWAAVRPNLNRMSEVAEWRRIVFGPVQPVIENGDQDYIATAHDLLPAGPFDDSTWQDWTGRLKTETGRKGRALFMPLRQALTGQAHGPEMAALLPLIGRDRARARLEGARA